MSRASTSHLSPIHALLAVHAPSHPNPYDISRSEHLVELTEVAELKAKGDSATTIATLKSEKAAAESYHTAYLEGLTKGLEMATSRAHAITPASAGAASR